VGSRKKNFFSENPTILRISRKNIRSPIGREHSRTFRFSFFDFRGPIRNGLRNGLRETTKLKTRFKISKSRTQSSYIELTSLVENKKVSQFSVFGTWHHHKISVKTCVNIKDAVSRIVSQTQIFKIFLLQVSQSPARSLKPIKSVNASTFAISFFLPENTCAQVCATRVFSSSTLTPEQFLLVDCYFSQ